MTLPVAWRLNEGIRLRAADAASQVRCFLVHLSYSTSFTHLTPAGCGSMALQADNVRHALLNTCDFALILRYCLTLRWA